MSTLKCTVPLCRWQVELSPLYDDMDSLLVVTKFHHLQNHHPILWMLIEIRATYRRVKRAVRE